MRNVTPRYCMGLMTFHHGIWAYRWHSKYDCGRNGRNNSIRIYLFSFEMELMVKVFFFLVFSHFSTALFDNDWRHCIDTIYFYTSPMHGRRRSIAWPNHIDNDFCHGHCYLYSSNVGMPATNGSGTYILYTDDFHPRNPLFYVCVNIDPKCMPFDRVEQYPF